MNSKQALLDFFAPTFDLLCAVACIYKLCSLYSMHFKCWEILLWGFFIGLFFCLSGVFWFLICLVLLICGVVLLVGWCFVSFWVLLLWFFVGLFWVFLGGDFKGKISAEMFLGQFFF